MRRAPAAIEGMQLHLQAAVCLLLQDMRRNAAKRGGVALVVSTLGGPLWGHDKHVTGFDDLDGLEGVPGNAVAEKPRKELLDAGTAFHFVWWRK